ncbi:OLC1v1016470C1 [Oldenlandia corymbosa var. corymbosa]|uniref:OLC1v1016470C1 n=1 Tax=Oldenlandia corymbosa var. corymbosa TaxID=529605 RepID=A0AAV1E717_OLDCO|nr:OLC1v1016470C1 [Oldenlandia corymbosa var. corymbosa]
MPPNTRKRKTICNLQDEPIENPPRLTQRQRMNQTRKLRSQESMMLNRRDTEAASNEQEDDEITHEHEGKRTRGKTMMLATWGRPWNLPPIKLDFDDDGKAIARNNMYCPIHINDWRKIHDEDKEDMLATIAARFDITMADTDWILTCIKNAWKNWKNQLKNDYFLPNKEVPHSVELTDDRVNKEQWEKIQAYWNDPKVEDGFEQRRNELHEGAEDPLGPNDIFAQVVGPDPPGRLRMIDTGIYSSNASTNVSKRQKYKRELLEYNREMVVMKNSLDDIKSQMTSQQKSPQDSSTSIPTDQPLQVKNDVHIKSLTDPTKIVAKGVLRSLDPDTEVGRIPLGLDWCEVHINSVIHYGERLVRPYDWFLTFEDALGVSVAWPCNLVKVIE